MLRSLVLAMIAGHHRHLSIDHYFFRLAFAAHRGDGRGRRADEFDVVLDALLGK